jgi:gentisate 1,2-dioxygenase
MTQQLGRLEDLPTDYLEGLGQRNLTPLWPALRQAVPSDRPNHKTAPAHWSYLDIKPDLLRAGTLTPIEKAERRVLVLCNPGFGAQGLRATGTIYAGLQLILPGEQAPLHRHTPSAVRFVIEGEGGYTVVNGERLPMEKGDLILTPAWQWHEHGHEGTEPVIWLDALDLPLLLGMEASYVQEGARQAVTDAGNSSNLRYRRGGLVPYECLDRERAAYPLLRFPWREVKDTLDLAAQKAPSLQSVHMAYVNPETGRECLPTLGFSALRISTGSMVSPRKRSASAVLHVVLGGGTIVVDGTAFSVATSDSVAVPTHAKVTIQSAAHEPLYVFMIDDAPLQRKIGVYQEFEPDR